LHQRTALAEPQRGQMEERSSKEGHGFSRAAKAIAKEGFSP
jgi:hypothetical protein